MTDKIKENKELLVTHSQVLEMLNKLQPHAKDGSLPLVVVDNQGNLHKIRDTHVFGPDPETPVYSAFRIEPLDQEVSLENPGITVWSQAEQFICKATGIELKKVRWLVHLMHTEGLFILEQKVIRNNQKEVEKLIKENSKIPLLQSKVSELNEYIVSLNQEILGQQEHIDNLLEKVNETK